MKLGDYQIDNLKLTTLGWWSAMHGEQILRAKRGERTRLFRVREKQEDFCELQERLWAEGLRQYLLVGLGYHG